MGSSVHYNGLGGTSTSAISQAAAKRASALASATSASSSSPSTSVEEDYYKTFSMDQTKIEKSLKEREEDPVTDSGLVASLKFFDDYNHHGGRKFLRDFMGQTWLRTLEWVQGVTVPDESEGAADLSIFLDSVFNSPGSFNTRVETAFLLHKLEVVKGAVLLEVIQLYAARFAATLEDWIPRFPSPNDRVLNERLVSYFYKGIEPKPLRTLVNHFRDVFDQFRLHFTESVVKIINLETTNSRLRDRHFCSKQQQQQIPEFRQPLGGEQRAKKTDSAGTKDSKGADKLITISGESLPIFNCDNCGGTQKSMNC